MNTLKTGIHTLNNAQQFTTKGKAPLLFLGGVAHRTGVVTPNTYQKMHNNSQQKSSLLGGAGEAKGFLQKPAYLCRVIQKNILMYRFSILISCIAIIAFSSCRETRMHEHADWSKHFEAQGITKACFILRDNNHESVHYYNKDRCIERFSPASTFKIFNSLVGLETATALDEQMVIKWDSVVRWNPDWNKDMNMREAFKVSNVGYFQELARRIGPAYMKFYLDTASYGNRNIGGGIDQFWLNDSLQISADEQLGFVKRLYFNELPFSERSQRIVRSMMLQEETPAYRLFYKTGWAQLPAKQVLWVVGYIEKIEHMKEHENSMNKSNERMYPYFFAQNFELAPNDTVKNWGSIRIDILKDILKDFGAMPRQ